MSLLHLSKPRSDIGFFQYHQICAQIRIKVLELVHLGYVLFLKGWQYIEFHLLEIKDQIERALLHPGVTCKHFLGLRPGKLTLVKKLKCCIPLLQIWFLNQFLFVGLFLFVDLSYKQNVFKGSYKDSSFYDLLWNILSDEKIGRSYTPMRVVL